MESTTTSIPTITENISNTMPEQHVTDTTESHITAYNEDLAAYLSYIRNGSKLYDGVTNPQVGSIAAVAPRRKNGVPWFGRILSVDHEEQKISLRWLDRVENKTIYFYLSDSEEIVHFETVICTGVDFEPIVGSKMMWKLVTPLCFIQAMNQDEPPQLIQQNLKVRAPTPRNKYDLGQLVFANADEFMNFLKVMQ